MTEPSQYFKGRTVQEQMNEVIGYVDVRAEEVASAKADDVLEPAEQAKDDAIAAKEAAEQARDTTLAALPQIQQDITDLKAEDVALDGRLDNVELRITTAEGNIVTIQGRVTAIETKNSQQDTAIAALQTADGQNVKISRINEYAVGLTGNQANILGDKTFKGSIVSEREAPRIYFKTTAVTYPDDTQHDNISYLMWLDAANNELGSLRLTIYADNRTAIQARVKNSNNTFKYITLALGDVI